MTKSRVPSKQFVVGTSRRERGTHTLLLQMAKEAKQLAQQAARIADLRDRKGRQEGRHVPQPEVADAVGVTLRAYQAWEGGASDPTRENRRALADYFGVTSDYIELGQEQEGRAETPDPFASSDLRNQLDRIENLLTDLHERLTAAETFQAVDQPAAEGTPRAQPPRRTTRRQQAG